MLDFYYRFFYNPIRKKVIPIQSIKETVAQNLRRVCKLKGIKSKDIAAHMGVSESAVSHWFKGDNSLDVDNLYKLCQFIGVSLDQVFGVDPFYVTVLTPEENDLLIAYRKAGSETKENIRSILRLPAKKDTAETAI